jgi:hypothetical protein
MGERIVTYSLSGDTLTANLKRVHIATGKGESFSSSIVAHWRVSVQWKYYLCMKRHTVYQATPQRGTAHVRKIHKAFGWH